MVRRAGVRRWRQGVVTITADGVSSWGLTLFGIVLALTLITVVILFLAFAQDWRTVMVPLIPTPDYGLYLDVFDAGRRYRADNPNVPLSDIEYEASRYVLNMTLAGQVDDLTKLMAVFVEVATGDETVHQVSSLQG